MLFLLVYQGSICRCNLTCVLLSLQIDAHSGGVNDLAFAHPNKQLCLVSCGDDKMIKVRAIFMICFD